MKNSRISHFFRFLWFFVWSVSFVSLLLFYASRWKFLSFLSQEVLRLGSKFGLLFHLYLRRIKILIILAGIPWRGVSKIMIRLSLSRSEISSSDCQSLESSLRIRLCHNLSMSSPKNFTQSWNKDLNRLLIFSRARRERKFHVVADRI